MTETLGAGRRGFAAPGFLCCNPKTDVITAKHQSFSYRSASLAINFFLSSYFRTFDSLSSSSARPCFMAVQSSKKHAVDWQREAATVEGLWQQFFADPSQWWDQRCDKKNLRFPDFKQKTALKVLWINNKLNPPWVQARLAAMEWCREERQFCPSVPEISERAIKREELWQAFFSDPSQWWDNRFLKKHSKYPDFKHKSTCEGLWIDGWLNPTWVKAKLSKIYPGDGLQSGIRIPLSSVHDVSNLCEEEKLKESLNFVEHMLQQNIQAPLNAYVELLKACGREKSLAEGRRVHALIFQSGYDSEVILGNMLIYMYLKCDSLFDARKVLNSMPTPNVISWTSIISAYANVGQASQALTLFRQMQQTGVVPDAIAFIAVLKACTGVLALEQGKQLHSEIIEQGLGSDVIVGSALIDMYAKCGCTEHAYQVFNSIPKWDVATWNAMITGYVHRGLNKDAFALYEQMKYEGLQPNNITYMALLNACANAAALEEGKWIHFHIVRSGFDSDVVVGNSLVNMYAKCGSIQYSLRIFNNMCVRNVVSWTAIITGYVQEGCCQEAFSLYKQMKEEGMQPDGVTYVVLLKACASLAAMEKVKLLHSHIINKGLELDVVVGSALVDTYAKCGSVECAHEVFNNMPQKNVVSWNALIAGYVHQGCAKEALALYEQMQQEGINPDDVTFLFLLKACASVSSLELGRQLHSHIIKSGFGPKMTLSSALVDMYSKCKSIHEAREVFNNICEPDVVSWTAMIAGYAQKGLGMEALALYEQMKGKGVKPDCATYVLLLKACANTAALREGKELHFLITRSGFESDPIVGSALVDMYAKCGCIEHARRVFDNISDRDVVLWNAMILGYAHQGLGNEALTLFKQMQSEGTCPNEVTYITILTACSHSGLVDEGRRLFNSMCNTDGVTITRDHCSCMVDLLGRAGCLYDAEDFINKMPLQPDSGIWMMLLVAARNHGNVEIGRRAFYSVAKLEPKNAAASVKESSC